MTEDRTGCVVVKDSWADNVILSDPGHNRISVTLSGGEGSSRLHARDFGSVVAEIGGETAADATPGEEGVAGDSEHVMGEGRDEDEAATAVADDDDSEDSDDMPYQKRGENAVASEKIPPLPSRLHA